LEYWCRVAESRFDQFLLCGVLRLDNYVKLSLKHAQALLE
jgi:hypothetical protein